jgi:hypothetical protein
MIWDDINRQMRPEVMRLANKFDGRAVRSATQILISNEIAIRRITREDGNKVIRAVRRIVPEDAPDRDNPENRYTALTWVIEVAPFNLLRSFLEDAQESG